MPSVAIVAALEREVAPEIRKWRAVEREHEGRRYRCFEKHCGGDCVVLICGGIGLEAARRACEAVIALYEPAGVYSIGFAGAAQPALKAGDYFVPDRVVDASDGSAVETHTGRGTLVSFGHVAGVEQKAKLAKAYGAAAVDMEAAAVARASAARAVRFCGARKAISDEYDFEMPLIERFISSDGRFRSAAFALAVAVRPWLWLRMIALARNSRRASRTLGEWLGGIQGAGEPGGSSNDSVYASSVYAKR
jgi:adenosylhomocysteine nucleosidase